jgi:hypothetical protein
VNEKEDQALEELCRVLYKGDWHSFLVDLKKRLDRPSLPWKIRQNIRRDIQRIVERTS